MLSPYPALLMAAALFLPRPVDATPRDRMLVTTSWLKAHLSDPGLVLLQVGERSEYDREHIPGARFLQLRAISDRPANGRSLEMLPITTLDSVLATLGVTAGSKVVIYFGSDWVSPTTRAWLTMEYAGLGDRAVILDGGLPAWEAAGYAVTADVPAAPNVTRLVTTSNPGVVVNADWVQARLTQPRFRLIDARDPQFYQGLDAGSGTRPGHLPGARSIPFTSVTDEAGRFLPDSALRRIFREAGVSQGDEIVAYCHIGQQATAVVFAAQLLGYNARLYDGSFEDWTRQEGLPVEGAVAATRGALISTDQLAARLATDSITVVDLRSDLNAYLADHLPGAVYLHYENLRVSAQGVPAGALPQSAYAEIWSRIGIRRDRPVVIYASGDAQNFNATFLAWLLAGFRQPEVYVLDGGYAKWAAEGKALTRLYPEIATVKYNSDPYLLDVIEGEHVQHMLGQQGVVLVDVRPADQFSGTAGAQMRRGHIPGAVSHFWHDDLVTTGSTTVWKPVETLRASYLAQGITPDKYVVIYCNTGTEASHAYFALKLLLGYPNVQVYVPSFTQWAENADWPLEGSGAAAR